MAAERPVVSPTHSPNEEHLLVTGGLGCIGSWAVRRSLDRGLTVSVFDRVADDHRLRLLLEGAERERVELIQGDVAELDELLEAIGTCGATRLLHLAALQVPACRANPPLGARVNVTGTANVFEAAAEVGISHVCYASSVAVYGPAEHYDASPLPGDAPPRPKTVYGVYKQTCEELAERYWENESISSVGLRPYVVYGPGRDRGLTSSPTRAMLAAVLDRPYRVPFGGRAEFQFAPDVADLFLRGALSDRDGPGVFNLGEGGRSMEELVAAIVSARPSAADLIAFEDAPLPFPPALDDEALQEAIGPFTYTSLEDGVRRTIERLERAVEEGTVSADRLEHR